MSSIQNDLKQEPRVHDLKYEGWSLRPLGTADRTPANFSWTPVYRQIS